MIDRPCIITGKGSDSMGNRLKELRESRGLSQAQLADRTGININSIISWEVGRRELVNIYTIIKLANALEYSVMDFIET